MIGDNRHTRRGTTLIVQGISEGVVMVADDLIYARRDGVAVPVETARKVFAFGSVLIGSAETLRVSEPIDADMLPLMAEHYPIAPGAGEGTNPAWITYRFEDWIIEFIREQRTKAPDNPMSIAKALDSKMRHTFKFVEILLRHGRWDDWVRGARFASYVVAGYSQRFKQLELIELGIEYDSGVEGNTLKYTGPIPHDSQNDLYLGEDQFFPRALQRLEPQFTSFQQKVETCFATADEKFPAVPERLRELAANLAARVKVEAQFNPTKVGATVKVAVLDRRARRHYLASF